MIASFKDREKVNLAFLEKTGFRNMLWGLNNNSTLMRAWVILQSNLQNHFYLYIKNIVNI